MSKEKTTKPWRLIYPNGEESFMNYNPIKAQRDLCLKEISKWWKKLTKERMGYKDEFYTLDKKDINKLKRRIRKT